MNIRAWNGNAILNLCIGLAVLLGILALVAVFGGTLPSPPSWLESWTAWLVTALGIVFAPLVLKGVAAALHGFASRDHRIAARPPGHSDVI